MDTSAERRRHTRFEVPCRLRIEMGEGTDLRTRALNISDGGAYFLVEEPPEVGQRVKVRLAVPRDTANTFFLEQFAAGARVVRRDTPESGGRRIGVALEFEKTLTLDLS